MSEKTKFGRLVYFTRTIPKEGTMKRIIGIRHRRKQTADQTASPTQVCIMTPDGELVRQLELPDQTAELDFLKGEFPVKMRDFHETDDLGAIPDHQIKWKKVKAELAGEYSKKKGKFHYNPQKVPAEYEGLQARDVVVMTLGGSGDRFAAALSKRGEMIRAQVYRLPPYQLKEFRGNNDKGDDSKLLAELFVMDSDLFYLIRPFDRGLIRIAEAFFARMEAMKARVACNNRLLQNAEGKIFLNDEGFFPEGTIEAQYDMIRANDRVYQALLMEETDRNKELESAVKSHELWVKIFEELPGVGPRIAGGLIALIKDMRRFETPAKLKKFCGVHVLGDEEPDKQFPRRRRGQRCNWNPGVRQTLYQWGDQFNRRPDSFWGQKLREYKAKFRTKYQEPAEVIKTVDGKKKTVKMYTDGHLHKRALWRTITKFVEWLWKEWWAIEKRNSKKLAA